MRDHEHRLVFAKCRESRLDQRLVFGVGERRRLVENHNWGVFQNGTRKRDALTLSPGKIHAGFSYHGVHAIGELGNDVIALGRMKSREYYAEFAKALPKDTVILTAGCAKYKYIKLGLGDIGGIPRVLDAGQCNDSYSLVLIALKLKEVFGLADVNELPIAYNIAWYEQKAVIVLLALLHLGVKNIHLGPTLPAFLSANVANVLVDTFGIGGIDSVDADLAMFMGA